MKYYFLKTRGKIMNDKLSKLKSLINEVHDINSAVAILGWDQQTYMPRGGAEDRANQLGALSRIGHIKFTSDEIGSLLEDLKDFGKSLEPDSDDARLLNVLEREYDKKTKVPPEMVTEFAEVTAIAQHVWEEAKEESNFEKFRPHLEKIVELRQKYAELFKPYDHIYDALLDDYEPGLKTSDVKEIFAKIRPQQVELIQAISEKPEIDNSFLFDKNYDEKKQWDFGVDVITKFGYDWNRGRQDKAVHPFTTTFGLGDVRITTRIFADNLGSGLFSTMHEGGHAMYEQGIDKNLRRTFLADGASLAVHESQSRLWENLVGRSKDFLTCFYPKLQETFSSQLGNIDMETFYKAINKVEPSLVRVESDEATYNLHIMLRLELEIALMENKLSVKDLPEAWNEKMKEYLDIVPLSDGEGVLQDVHWSCGILGYFPTYALGNLVSAQLWECINKDIPDLPEQIRKGEFSALLGWLREKIHKHGAKFEPQDLIQRATGSKIDPEPYIRYLKNKFGEIYSL
jgi:carboxypeptidase Taq